jgi:hypothetical protein
MVLHARAEYVKAENAPIYVQQITLYVRLQTSAMYRAHAIRQRDSAPIRPRQMARHVTTAMPVRQMMSVLVEYVQAQLIPVQHQISAIRLASVQEMERVPTPTSLTAQPVAMAMPVRQPMSVLEEYAQAQLIPVQRRISAIRLAYVQETERVPTPTSLTARPVTMAMPVRQPMSVLEEYVQALLIPVQRLISAIRLAYVQEMEHVPMPTSLTARPVMTVTSVQLATRARPGPVLLDLIQ